jgi:IS5 family transposase
MAEVGLVQFAQLAREVAEAALPSYRSKYSKRRFTQPQLLAILCLMRFEDWTFREAEVRLAEHRELREALRLTPVPDYSTLSRFLQRLEPMLWEAVLEETIRRSGLGRRPAVTAALDATGLAPGRVSTFLVRRVRDSGAFPWRRWTKWLVVAETRHRFLLAQHAKEGPINDSASLRPLAAQAHDRVPLARLLADAEFDSERNHRFLREQLGADSIIPAKRGKKDWRVQGIRAQMRAEFPRQLYSARAQIECLFSVAKRKLSRRAPGRSFPTQRLQALLLGLAYNIYLL